MWRYGARRDARNGTGAGQETALPVVDFILAGMAAVMGGVVLRPLIQRLKYHIAIVTRGQVTLPTEAWALTDVLISQFERLDTMH